MIGAVAVMVNVAKTAHQARFAAAAAEILTAKTAFGTDPGSSVTTVADVNPGPGSPCEDCKKMQQKGLLYPKVAVFSKRDIW